VLIVQYVLNNPPANWDYGTGFVTKEMIETHMPSKSVGEEKVLMCGPPPMMTAMK
jgi:cytochrome-b5 reductase